jgi:hypothetical protein
MSSLGGRRKARVIQTLDDDEVGAESNNHDGEFVRLPRDLPRFFADPNMKSANALLAETPQMQAPIKFTRKPNKSSALRKSINLADIDRDADGGAPVSNAASEAEGEEGSAPIVIRPSVSRSGSTKQRKKPASSRLSFGPDSTAGEDDGPVTTPAKPTLHQKAAENALRKKPISLPSRFLGGEDDRPRYSKEYLSELQSSTPNTPHDLSTLTLADDEDEAQLAMALDDPSELEGATVVAPSESTSSTALTSRAPAATILTAAQVREKKERRARLALQGGADDYIGLSDEDDDENRLTSKKKDSRLIAEDEDLGEGYDEYVEDGGLSLGRAAERKARAKRKKEMAELIASAEGAGGGGDDDDDDGDNSDDSLDLRTDYEAAQRRKGMGVEILGEGDGEGAGGAAVIPKMKPLPELGECLQRMRDLVQGVEDEVRQKRLRIAALQKEREEIVKREAEVQGVLDQAGTKYQAVLGSRPDGAKLAAQSPLRTGSSLPPLPPGISMPGLSVERGLESFGTTPTHRPEDEEMT